MADVTLQQVSKKYEGAKKNDALVTVLDTLDLTVRDKEFLVLVGPSGCGKSTILRLIAGLDFPSEGTIFINGNNVSNILPKDRDVAMVFQNYALYPHMTVFDNMAFGLKMRKMPKGEIQQKVAAVAKSLQLEALLTRKPKQLSGGQRQRVALGRAIVRNPKVFLMDEPLSNLDAKLRTHMRGEIAALHQRYKTTTIYVTHDQVEALTLGERIVVLNHGKVQQIDAPMTVYNKPVNRFVAGFIGQMYFLEAAYSAGNFQLSIKENENLLLEWRLSKPLANMQDGKVLVGIRPEHFSSVEGPHALPIKITPTRQEILGGEKSIFFRLQNQEASAKLPTDVPVSLDQTFTLWLQPAKVSLFHTETEEALLGAETILNV